MADTPLPKPPTQRLRAALDLVATIALIAAAALVVWKYWPRLTSPPIPTEPVEVGSAPSIGSRDAPIVMIEFSDFQCPFCGQFARETEPAFRTKYVDSGRVLLVFKHLPIEARHPAALAAAQVAQCADEQDLFWPVHDELFADQSDLAYPDVLKRVAKTGIDTGKVAACVGPSAEALVRKDLALARALSIRSTPTFLVGRLLPDGRARITDRLSGNLDLPTLDKMISDASSGWWSSALWIAGGLAATVAVVVLGRRTIRARRSKLSNPTAP